MTLSTDVYIYTPIDCQREAKMMCYLPMVIFRPPAQLEESRRIGGRRSDLFWDLQRRLELSPFISLGQSQPNVFWRLQYNAQGRRQNLVLL